MERLESRARALVVGGFALTLVGSIMYVALLVHIGYFDAGQSLAAEGYVVLPVFSEAAALLGWWWLTRLSVAEPVQMTLLRRAFYALGIQYLLTASTTMCFVSFQHTVSTSDQLVMASLVIQAIGGLGTFIGFTVIAGVYTPRRELPRESPRGAARELARELPRELPREPRHALGPDDR